MGSICIYMHIYSMHGRYREAREGVRRANMHGPDEGSLTLERGRKRERDGARV